MVPCHEVFSRISSQPLIQSPTPLTCLGREFGGAFTERNLRYMRQFSLTYPNRSAMRSDLDWTHYRTLMRLPDDQRDFYAHLVVTGRWGGVATN